MNNHFKLVTAITLTGLLFGVLAITALIWFNALFIASAFIGLSGLCDYLDGKAARYYQVESSFGKVLDGLNDFISFTLAPLVMVYVLGFFGDNLLVSLLSVCFVLSGVIRLIKFQKHIVTPPFFTGLPTTAAGITLVLILLMHHAHVYTLDLTQITVILLVLTVLMNAPITLKKLK